MNRSAELEPCSYAAEAKERSVRGGSDEPITGWHGRAGKWGIHLRRPLRWATAGGMVGLSVISAPAAARGEVGDTSGVEVSSDDPASSDGSSRHLGALLGEQALYAPAYCEDVEDCPAECAEERFCVNKLCLPTALPDGTPCSEGVCEAGVCKSELTLRGGGCASAPQPHEAGHFGAVLIIAVAVCRRQVRRRTSVAGNPTP